ncbi:MAG: DUF1572 family protein [Gemmatimonadaceae bacterium]|nr:DUF1572 family protein [Gemmatimonadaceae bacterium]
MDSRDVLRDTVLRLLLRDLAALQREVTAYPDDASLWRTAPSISNSGGTLALHLAGNLRGFISSVLGGSEYVRDREREFTATGLSRADVTLELADAEIQVMRALSTLDLAQLDVEYPHAVMATRLRTDVFLMHLACHASYHLGQIDYHRRLMTGDSATAKTLSIPALVEPLPDYRAI